MKTVRLFVATILVLLSCSSVFAQNFELKGVVTDAETGEPIPFASVLLKGSTIGVACDGEGVYNIVVPIGKDNVLLFTSIGYQRKEVAIGKELVINVALETDAKALDDVVVVAYGASKKEAVTGSVTSMKGDQLAALPVTSVDKALGGKLAGVSITSSTGQPGSGSSIRIRGTSSIHAGNSPLWVIDGIPVMTGDLGSGAADAQSSLMTSLNPNDVESITVLKDAAAAAVYGSRAANGVILVTTKSGRAGKAQFDARVKYGVQWFQSDTGYRMMTGEELLSFQRDAIRNAGMDPDDPTSTYYRPLSLLNLEQTNWLEHFTKLGQLQEYEISARGGSDKAKYFSSVSYHKNDGVVYGTDYQKIQARVNVDYKLLKNLETGIRVNLAYTDQNNAPTDGLAYENPMWAGMTILPWTPKYNEKGEHNTAIAENSGKNPRASAAWNETKLKSYRLNATMFLRWEIIKNLVAETKNSVEGVLSDQHLFYSKKAGYDNITQDIQNEILNLTTSNTINYTNVFGGYHHFRALIGQEANRYIGKNSYYDAFGVNPDIPFPGTADQTKTSVATGITRDSMLSFFGIVDYSYDDRYFVQATLRADGSSLFGQKNKWGTFWSVSGSWNLSNEKWLRNYRPLDILKLRLSYGVNGNNNIGAYRAYGTYGTTMYNGLAGMLPESPENQELSWEKNATWNVGLDFGFFQRLRFSLDVYNRVTKDMLLYKKVPQTSGFNSNFMNTGSLRNYGVELQMDGDIISTRDWNWNLGFNIAHNRSEILDLGGEEMIEMNGSVHHRVGMPIYSFYLSDFYTVNPTNGEALWVAQDEYDEPLTNDYNKARKKYCGSPEPDVVGGFNTTLTWKGLSLSAFFEYKIGGKILNVNERSYCESDGASMTMNQIASAGNYWKKPGDVGVNPKPIAGHSTNSNGLSDRYLEDGSYLRFKDITLSYSLPRVALKKMHIQGLRFYVSGLNLYTFSHVHAFDPEAGSMGVVQGIYPYAKSVVGGIELTF